MPALSLPPAAFMNDPEIAIFADTVARFFQREAPAERMAKWRAQKQVDRDVWEKAGVDGFLGVSIPVEYGGAGGDFRHDVVIADQASKYGVDGFAIPLHNIIVLPYILIHGTEEQKLRWLPRLCSGELIGAIAMSEPSAGSDLQAIRTTAAKDGTGYRINGTKTFITNGQLGNLIVVVTKTDMGKGAKGTSLFVLETDGAEGFKRGKVLDKIGHDAQDTSELFFDDVFVPAENLLGLEEGRGFAQLMAELPRERLLIAIQSVNTMERAINATLDYVKSRKAFGQAVFDFQNTQFKLADAKAQATVAKIFVNDCIAKAIDGILDSTTSAIAKMWTTETEWQIIDDCLQLHGGYGYINEYPIARMFRDSRVQRIYGGSNEIMKVLIGRSLA